MPPFTPRISRSFLLCRLRFAGEGSLDGLTIAVNDCQIRARGRVRREAALLPIAQACQANGIAKAEFFLRQASLGANRFYVDLCRHKDLISCGIGLTTRDRA